MRAGGVEVAGVRARCNCLLQLPAPHWASESNGSLYCVFACSVNVVAEAPSFIADSFCPRHCLAPFLQQTRRPCGGKQPML